MKEGYRMRLSLPVNIGLLVAGCAAGYFLVRGSYLDAGETAGAGALAVAGLLLLLSFASTALFVFEREGGIFKFIAMAVGWTLAYRTAVDLTGGLGSPIYPPAYLFAAVAGAFAPIPAAVAAIVMFVGVEIGEGYVVAGVFPWEALPRVAAMIAVGAVVGAFYRNEKARIAKLEENLAVFQRGKESIMRHAPGDEFKSIREEGRREHLNRSVRGLQDALNQVLGELKDILKAHTVILFTLDRSTGELRFRDASSDSENINRSAAIGEGEGILGWVYREREALRITDYSHPPENLVYYLAPEKVRSIVAVPVIRESSDQVEGMLVVDSMSEAYFGPEDEKVIWMTARQAMKEMETAETRTREMSEATVSQALYKVSEILNASLNPEQVLDATMDCVNKIVEADFWAVALYDEAGGLSTILRAKGEDADRIQGKTFTPTESLVGWVTSPERYLFYPDYKSRKIQKPIFGKDIPSIKNIGTFFCYPLVSATDFLGSLTIAFRDEQALPDFERNAVTTLARMAATSIANANLHERVAKMATTDGLTGLVNHRHFQERFTERVEEARRHPTKHTLILTDIDHFKKVNDTHGHPVGDDVLRKIAKLLRESVRNVDIAARYGGEEFVLLLSNTDRKGAMLLAERIRKEAKKMKFDGEDGHFSITISMGVATFPEDGRSKDKIIEHADEALYFAKEHGRDRVVAYDEIRGDETTGPMLAAGRV